MDIYTYTFGQGTSPDQDKLSWGRFPYVSPAMVEKQKAAQKAAAEEWKKPVDQRNRVQITCKSSSAFHVQVSCYMPLGTKGQLSCLV